VDDTKPWDFQSRQKKPGVKEYPWEWRDRRQKLGVKGCEAEGHALSPLYIDPANGHLTWKCRFCYKPPVITETDIEKACSGPVHTECSKKAMEFIDPDSFEISFHCPWCKKRFSK